MIKQMIEEAIMMGVRNKGCGGYMVDKIMARYNCGTCKYFGEVTDGGFQKGCYCANLNFCCNQWEAKDD